MERDIYNARNLAIGTLFILAFFFAINPISRTALGIYLFFLIITIVVYSVKDYKPSLIGISTKNLGSSVVISLIITALFFLFTKLVPGASIGLPLLPNAISDELKFFITVVVAPICEELFFRGSLLGYLRNFQKPSKKRVWISIFIVSIAFSLFHLGAYIGGLYSLPNFSSALASFSANLSGFISAFLVGIILGWVAVKKNSLIPSILIHLLFNLIIYTALSVAFI